MDDDTVTRTGRNTDRGLAPLLATAAVVAVVLGGFVVFSQVGGSGTDEVGDTGGPAGAQSAEGTRAPKQDTLTAGATAGWQVVRPNTCAAWKPTDENAVVVLHRLTEECLARATMKATTVFITSYRSTLYDEPWARVTEPWRAVDGLELRRLSSGRMMEISSRVFDVVVCKKCDQAIVATGPDPKAVRGVIDSVARST